MVRVEPEDEFLNSVSVHVQRIVEGAPRFVKFHFPYDFLVAHEHQPTALAIDIRAHTRALVITLATRHKVGCFYRRHGTEYTPNF